MIAANTIQQNPTPKQEIALGELMMGRTVTDAASAAGVNRGTVHDWLNESTFHAEYDRRLQEMRTKAKARLMGLVDIAIDAVAEALARGDEKTALQLLKGMNLLDNQPRQIEVKPAKVIDWDALQGGGNQPNEIDFRIVTVNPSGPIDQEEMQRWHEAGEPGTWE